MTDGHIRKSLAVIYCQYGYRCSKETPIGGKSVGVKIVFGEIPFGGTCATNGVLSYLFSLIKKIRKNIVKRARIAAFIQAIGGNPSKRIAQTVARAPSPGQTMGAGLVGNATARRKLP